MRKLILTVLCLAASAACLSAGPLSGRRIPSFSLPDSNSNYHDILDYRGKVVLVEVMQTGCSHCQELAAQLEKVQDKYGNTVPILSIVVPPDNAETVKQYSVRFHIRYPILFDCGQVAASLMRATPANPRVNFPHLFVVDKSGMIREDYDWESGQVFLSGQGLIQSIDRLMAGAPAKVPTKPVKN
jgi:peroxiredoxin